MGKTVGATVLVVDDEPDVLVFLKRTLQACGYTVIASKSAEEALNLPDSRKKEVDLLLADVLLPGIKGHELAEVFKDIHPEVKLLFMSGYLCPAMAQTMADDQENAFLQKPFTPATLVDKMKKILR